MRRVALFAWSLALTASAWGQAPNCVTVRAQLVLPSPMAERRLGTRQGIGVAFMPFVVNATIAQRVADDGFRPLSDTTERLESGREADIPLLFWFCPIQLRTRVDLRADDFMVVTVQLGPEGVWFPVGSGHWRTTALRVRLGDTLVVPLALDDPVRRRAIECRAGPGPETVLLLLTPVRGAERAGRPR